MCSTNVIAFIIWRQLYLHYILKYEIYSTENASKERYMWYSSIWIFAFLNFDLYSIFIILNVGSFKMKSNLHRIGRLYKIIFQWANDMLNGKIATIIYSVLWYNANFNIEKEIGAQEWTKSIKLQKNLMSAIYFDWH